MSLPECLTLDSNLEGNEMKLSTKKRETSDPSKSPEPLPKKTLLSLPDEVLSSIVGQLQSNDHRKHLQRSAKRFYSLCRPWIWREVEFEEEIERHDTLMSHLVTTSLAALVRSVDYALTSPFSKMSALILSTSFTNITNLTIRANYNDESEVGARLSVPRAMTAALRSLVALRSLQLQEFLEVEDTSFSLAMGLPRLTSLAVDSLAIANSLFKNGPALRSLEIGLNDFGCAAIVACAETLRSLSLNRDQEEGEGLIAQNKCFKQLRLLFDPMRNKHHPFPIQSLTLENFELLAMRDNVVRPYAELIEFLSAFKETSLSTLRIKWFDKIKSSANIAPGIGLLLPNVKNLEFTLGYQEKCALDQASRSRLVCKKSL